MAIDRKFEIIEAATRVLLRSNYQNMKTANIAKEAGISEAALYRYFNSKKDIFVGILKNFNMNINGTFFKNVKKDNTMSNNFYIIGDNFYNRLMEEKILYKIVYKAYSEMEDEEIQVTLRETFDIIGDTIEKVIRWGVEKKEIFLKDVDIEILAMAIWGTAEVVFRKHIVNGEFNVEKKELLNLGAVFFNLLVK